MPIILAVLRVVHIVAGAFWVGSALMPALGILPGLRKAGQRRAICDGSPRQAMLCYNRQRLPWMVAADQVLVF